MKPNKWTTVSPKYGDKKYLALLSYLPVKSYLIIPKVSRYAAAIDIQLKNTEGVIGYSFQAELIKKKFWTLSVWENRSYLNEFVNRIPHSDVMNNLAPHMKKTKFIFWEIDFADIPPSWEDAKKRIEF